MKKDIIIIILHAIVREYIVIYYEYEHTNNREIARDALSVWHFYTLKNSNFYIFIFFYIHQH